MIHLGLNTADLRLYQQSLYTGYNLKVVVQILDLDHRYISDVSDMLLDGQVNKDFFAPISSSASLTLLDPDNQTGFDTSGASDNVLYATRMIKIVYSVWSELLPRWVDCPIFCGPVTKVARDDAVLSVECEDKASLSDEPALLWAGHTYAKGTKLTSTVSHLMRTYTGETRFDLPGWTTKLAVAHSVHTETVPWVFARAIVGSRSYRQLFYDGRGVLRLRGTPTRPVFTFTEPWLLSVPKLDFNSGDVKNLAYVKGAVPDKKPQIRAWRHLPPSHPASAVAVARNGVHRRLAEVVDDSSINTQAEANARADELLDSISATNIGFDFDSFPTPHLEPGDIFHLSTRDVSINLRMKQFAIPLKAGTAQSNGTIRKLSVHRARRVRRGR